MRAAFAIISSILALMAYVPYVHAVLHGRTRPARATRGMFAVLLIVTLLQQNSLASGGAMAVTAGEALGSLGILVLSVRHGIGGWRRLDKICYALLALDIAVWQASRSPLTALWLSVLADLVAFTPTLHKTWREPKSEAPLFYAIGALAPVLSIAAAASLDLKIVLFPAYLAIVNVAELLLILRLRGATLQDDSLL